MANKQINTILTLTDRMSAPLLKIKDNMGEVSRETKRSVAEVNRFGKKFEKSIDGAIKSTFKWGKRLAILGGGASIKFGIEGLNELEYGAAKVDTIARGALEIKDIQEGLLRMSTQLGGGITPGQIGEAQYSAISSGISPEDSLAFTEVAGKLEVAGFTDINSAIKLLTSTMNAFNMTELQDAKRLSDEFLYTQNLGVITVDEMAQSYGALTPLFSSMNLGTQDMNVAIATLTKMGLGAPEAVTATRAAITSLIKPSKDAAEYADSIGIELSGSALEAKGFAGMMSDIIDKTGGDIDSIVRLFPNIRGMLAGLNLTSEEGIAIFNEIAEGISNADGLTDEAFEKLSNTVPYRIDSVKQSLKNLNTAFYADDRFKNPLLERLIELDEYLKSDEGQEAALQMFDKIYKAIDKLIDIAAELFNFIRDNQAPIKKAAQAIFSFYIAIKSMRVVSKIYKTIKPFFELLKSAEFIQLGAIGEIALVLFGIVQVIEYFKTHMDSLRESYPELFEIIDTVKEKLSELWEIMQEHGMSVGEVVGGIITIISTFLEFFVGVFVHTVMTKIDSIRMMVEGFFDIFGGLVDVFVGVVSGDWAAAWEGVKRVVDGAVTMITGWWQNLVSFITIPVDAVVDILSKKFHAKADAIREKWDNIKKWLRNPISGTVKLIQERFSSKSGKAANNWSGTSYFRGGLTHLHERGGEIYDLPQGTRIYPHDESIQMAMAQGMAMGGGSSGGGSSVSVNLNIHGNVYGEEDMMNRVGNNLVRVINDNLKNM